MKEVISSDVLMAHVSKALGLDDYPVRAIALYMKKGEPIEVTIECVGTVDLENIVWVESPPDWYDSEDEKLPENGTLPSYWGNTAVSKDSLRTEGERKLASSTSEELAY